MCVYPAKQLHCVGGMKDTLFLMYDYSPFLKYFYNFVVLLGMYMYMGMFDLGCCAHTVAERSWISTWATSKFSSQHLKWTQFTVHN